MKVVFVNRYFFPDQSATSQLLTDLATALVKGRESVHVICSRQLYENAKSQLPVWESVGGVTVHRVWTSRFGRSRILGRAMDYVTFYVAATLKMIRLLNRGDVVVAKTDPPLISIPAMIAAKIRGAVLINWLQDIFPEVATALGANPMPWALNSLLLRLRNRSLNHARFNIALGERMRARLQSVPLPQSKIRIIPNWAEAAPVAPKAVGSSGLRTRLELAGAFVVGYSGNLGRAHDFQTLLDTACLLRDQSDVIFLMVGGGGTMLKLERAVAAAGLRNFRFLPYQPRESVGDCLAAADVHWVTLIPSLEGLVVPSKYYGILAAARPVVFIGDPEGELAADIRIAECGAVVAIGDSPQLAALLQRWKVNKELCREMGGKAHRRYCERFAMEHALQQWQEVIKNSASRAPNRLQR